MATYCTESNPCASEPLKRTGPRPVSLQVTGFRSYVDLYVKDKLDETGVTLKVVNESVNERWEVGLAMSEKGFQQISFVNSIATTKVRPPPPPGPITPQMLLQWCTAGVISYI